jgi:hypothetical protein
MLQISQRTSQPWHPSIQLSFVVPLFGYARSQCRRFHFKGLRQCHLAERSRRCWRMAPLQLHLSRYEGSPISLCSYIGRCEFAFI